MERKAKRETNLKRVTNNNSGILKLFTELIIDVQIVNRNIIINTTFKNEWVSSMY